VFSNKIHLNYIISTLTSKSVQRSGYLMADRGIGARYSAEETSELSALCSSNFTPEEQNSGTRSMGRCVSSRAGLGSMKEWEIFCAHRQSNRSHPIVHPVADSTVTGHSISVRSKYPCKFVRDQCKKKSSKDKGLEDVRRKQS
jgi:hypothetical protein